MALVHVGLWSIVAGTETLFCGRRQLPSKFIARQDHALVTIVLAVKLSLFHLIGNPDNPVIVRQKLQDQFQKKTWANKLALQCQLQDHIKLITELFNELVIVDDNMDKENQAVYLLASLPDSFNPLVTALEANKDIPKYRDFHGRTAS